MKKQLEQRLKELRKEFDDGQKMLKNYEVQQQKLNETLLRISGAIQVLQEEIANLENSSTDTEKEVDVDDEK